MIYVQKGLLFLQRFRSFTLTRLTIRFLFRGRFSIDGFLLKFLFLYHFSLHLRKHGGACKSVLRVGVGADAAADVVAGEHYFVFG